MFPFHARWFRSVRRAFLMVLLAGGHWAATTDLAWAKPHKEPNAEKPEKSYVMPYGVVVLGIALGMILVLRPVKRDNEPKRIVKEE